MPMFKPQKSPRIFGLPSGLDFPNAVVSGLIDRAQSMTPEEFAKVEVFVNTQRMQRRIKSLFADGTARLLPRIRVVSDLGHDLALPNIPPATSPLRRTLELAQLITKLVENDPEIAPKSSIFDLADSLSSLMDEMQGEGVKSDAIAALNVDDQSGHWQRSLQFISLVKAYLANDQLDAPTRKGDNVWSSSNSRKHGPTPPQTIRSSSPVPRARAAPPRCSCAPQQCSHKARSSFPATIGKRPGNTSRTR